MSGSRRGFGKLRKLPSGRWQASYVGPDLLRHQAPDTFETRTDAEWWLGSERRVLESFETTGSEWTPPKERSERAKVKGETFAAWAPDAVSRRRIKGRPLKPTTRANYLWHVEHSIGPVLGDLELRAISAAKVAAWYDDLLPDRPTLRAQAYSTLRTLMLQAVEEGLITDNPCVIKGAGRAERKRKIEPATPAEIADLTRAMPEQWRALVLLAAWCGLRWGELAGLTRGDVDLSRGVVKVERAVTRVEGKTIVGSTKSTAGTREVHIPALMIPALESHLDKHTGTAKGSLLFPRPGTNTPLLHKSVNEALVRAREQIGRPDLRLHDLRHTSAVLAAQSGATLAELMARLGHSTPQAAMRYQHAAQGRDAAIAERMSQLGSIL